MVLFVNPQDLKRAACTVRDITEKIRDIKGSTEVNATGGALPGTSLSAEAQLASKGMWAERDGFALRVFEHGESLHSAACLFVDNDESDAASFRMAYPESPAYNKAR